MVVVSMKSGEQGGEAGKGREGTEGPISFHVSLSAVQWGEDACGQSRKEVTVYSGVVELKRPKKCYIRTLVLFRRYSRPGRVIYFTQNVCKDNNTIECVAVLMLSSDFCKALNQRCTEKLAGNRDWIFFFLCHFNNKGIQKNALSASLVADFDWVKVLETHICVLTRIHEFHSDSNR